VFTLKGKPVTVSREFVRAWIEATYCVLSYHRRRPAPGLTITLTAPERLPDGRAGDYGSEDHRVRLRADLPPEVMATTILHELIHAALSFGEDTEEKCTSTLTAKLKPTIAPVAQAILDNTYRNAAYFAHTKLSYRATNGDHYDTAEDAPIGTEDRYGR
jgi:hypothetical protein